MTATGKKALPRASMDTGNWDATFLYWAGQEQGVPIRTRAPIAKPRPPKRTVRAVNGELPASAIQRQINKPNPNLRRANEVALDAGRAKLPSALAVLPDFAQGLDASGKLQFSRGLSVVVVALGLAGAWAGFVPLSGAVVASGTVVAASEVKKIQHPIGGVVREIRIHDGSTVSTGEILVKLDPTNARGSLEIAAKRLLETRGLIQRLTAERDGKAASELELAPIEGVSEVEAGAVLTAQHSLLEVRAAARRRAIALQQAQIEELQHSIESAQSQLASKLQEGVMVSTELVSIEALYRDKLTTLNRVMGLRREKAELEGSVGSLEATISETQAKIAEAKLELDRKLEEVQTQVLTDLREAEGKENELVEQQRMAREQLSEIDIRAPQSGVIHDLSVHTVGGVVSPAEVLMLIEPDGDNLEVEVQLQPKDIAQVTVGQTAMVRFAAFDRNATPELRGTVAYVSPDTIRDPRTNAPSYKARIAMTAEEASRLGDFHLISGMPAEVYLITQSRTALTYLLKPFLDQLHRMFRGR